MTVPGRPLQFDNFDAAPPAYSSLPPQYAEPGISLRQIWLIIRHYWKLSVAIAAGVFAVAAVAVFLLPRAYVATATLMVNDGNRDPLAGETMPSQAYGNYVATQAELIMSPVVLLPVVDVLKMAEDPRVVGGFSGGADARRDYAMKALGQTLEVNVGRGGQLLFVTATAHTAAKAAEVANAVANVYLRQERERLSDPAAERAKRYAEQLAELRSKVEAVQERVAKFRSEHQLTEIAATDQNVDRQTLSDLERRLVEAENARRAVEARAAQSSTASDAAMASRSVEQLRDRLASQEADLARLSSTYGPQHPRVLEVQAQMAATRRSLGAELHTLSDNSTEQLRSARALEAKFRAALEAQRTKVLSVREEQDEGAKLQLEFESAQAVYKRALDGYDQVLFASSGNRTNVSLISSAAPPAKAAKPKRLKLLLMALMAGLGAGLALPFLYEMFFHRMLRSRDDFERSFGVPVLAELNAARPGVALS